MFKSVFFDCFPTSDCGSQTPYCPSPRYFAGLEEVTVPRRLVRKEHLLQMFEENGALRQGMLPTAFCTTSALQI